MQAALGELLALGAEVRAAIAARVATNRARLAGALPPDVRLHAAADRGRLVGARARARQPQRRGLGRGAGAEDGVLVHPGYFFDLRGGTFLVLSLLPAPELFADAIARLVARSSRVLR